MMPQMMSWMQATSKAMKRTFTVCLALPLLLTAHPSNAKTNGKIILGFSQVGAESAWRVANTKSVKQAAAQAGVFLNFADAQQKQANQIKAIKTFIMQKVDVIAIVPVVETGWHSVLVQAKKAKIPVIIVDRLIDEKDSSLYSTSIGSDFRDEGRQAGRCLVEEMKRRGLTNDSKTQINIVELRGTEGSAPAIERSLGFAEVLKEHPGFKIIRSEDGGFMEAKGKEVMEAVLKKERAQGRQILALYTHNDDMALGALSSMESAGLRPGKDIVVVSIDAVNEAMTAMKQGKINCIVECSPLLGPQLMTAVKDLVEGRSVPHKIATQETAFTSNTLKQDFPPREY